MTPMLIVFSGLPGAGKTTLARVLAQRLGAAYLRIDTIEQAILDSSLGLSQAGEAGYLAAYGLAEENLRLGLTVVADSVNPVKMTREAWHGVAARAGRACADVEIVCSDAAEHRRRVEDRRKDNPGLAMPNWQAVQARDYRPWQTECAVIDTAGRAIGSCLEELLACLPGGAQT